MITTLKIFRFRDNLWLCNITKRVVFAPNFPSPGRVHRQCTIVSKIGDLVYKIQNTQGDVKIVHHTLLTIYHGKKRFISHYQTSADETIGQNIELIQYSTSYVILPFIYTLYLYSYHRNSSYSCRVDGSVRHLTLGHSWRGTGRTSTALQRRVLTADTWCPRVDHT